MRISVAPQIESILQGSGTLRLAEEEILISQGDYIALPAGTEAAHQIINTSSAPYDIFVSPP